MSAEIVDIRQARLMRLARQILGEAGLPSFAWAADPVWPAVDEDTAPSEMRPEDMPA